MKLSCWFHLETAFQITAQNEFDATTHFLCKFLFVDNLSSLWKLCVFSSLNLEPAVKSFLQEQ